MGEKEVTVGLHTAISLAVGAAVEVAVRPMQLENGDYAVGLYIGNESKVAIPVQPSKDETTANLALKKALNFYNDIFTAAIKRALMELYKGFETVGWKESIDEFHRLFYDCRNGEYSTIWFGYPIVKTPMDLILYQEILTQCKPDLVIETGTMFGGSALFAASIFDLLGNGQVITIDVEKKDFPVHHRIRYLTGSSLDMDIFGEVESECSGKRVMVVLDSDHTKNHVLQEMEVYGPLVTSGQYMIVEDTNKNGHPVAVNFGPGPWEAVEEYLKTHKGFEQDRSRERYPFTFNPGGYLKKAK